MRIIDYRKDCMHLTDWSVDHVICSLVHAWRIGAHTCIII